MTREDILRVAHEAGFNWPEISTTTIEERLERFAALVAEVEREACAKVCEAQQNRVLTLHPTCVEVEKSTQNMVALKCAAAIRKRGEQ
ncbi:MAG: hypothetical protein ACO24B_08495 [Ilumatobacteraceae bacterium]